MKTFKDFAYALLLAISITSLAACAGGSSRESTGEYIDDSAITAKVKTELIQDKNVDAADVSVTTFKGQVQLSGFVDSDEEAAAAETAANRVAGVKSVENDLQVKGER